jgi:hypothetical protein
VPGASPSDIHPVANQVLAQGCTILVIGDLPNEACNATQPGHHRGNVATHAARRQRHCGGRNPVIIAGQMGQLKNDIVVNAAGNDHDWGLR